MWGGEQKLQNTMTVPLWGSKILLAGGELQDLIVMLLKVDSQGVSCRLTVDCQSLILRLVVLLLVVGWNLSSEPAELISIEPECIFQIAP